MNNDRDEAEEGYERREERDRYSAERLEQLEFGLAELENREARLLHEKAQWDNQRQQLIQYLENLDVQDHPQSQAMLSDLMNIIDPKVDKSQESLETHAGSQIEQSHGEYDENSEPVSTGVHSQIQSTTSISEVVIKSLKHITGLFENKSLHEQDDVPVALWQDELGRLRLWAANIGAHQRGESSLDHRLREASHIKDQTLRLLERLQRAAQDLEDALQGSESDDDFLGEESEEEETELQSIYYTMHNTIDNLFQMSMLIRRPAQHDRLFGTKRADAAPFEPFDRQHVESKYPQADHSVLNRLGLAISQRRAVMRYRERHHIKLAQGLGQAVGDQPDTVSTKLSETVATDFVDIPEPETETFESLSIASETSYAKTILQGGDGMTLPPPPKESADGAPFECPYCFMIISITKPNAWARHVFNDIMPYLCIFPDCSTPHRLYESRREWFSHLQDKHSIVSNANTTLECTLCMGSVPSGKQFERHVGRHLEELALFALPRSDNDGDEEALPSDASEATSGVEVDVESQNIHEESQGEEEEEIQIQKLSIPEDYLDCFIGHNSARISEICSRTSTSISIARYSHDETGERMFTIKGGHAKVQAALFLIYETLEARGAFKDGESRHHRLEGTSASPQTQQDESSSPGAATRAESVEGSRTTPTDQEASADFMNYDDLKETGDKTWGSLKQEIEGNVIRFRQNLPGVEENQNIPPTSPSWKPDFSVTNNNYDISSSSSSPSWETNNPDQSSSLPQPRATPRAGEESNPYYGLLEKAVRLEDLRQGDTIDPPCDRCGRLGRLCVKTSPRFQLMAACVECTRIDVQCSWRGRMELESRTAFTHHIRNPASGPPNLFRDANLQDPDGNMQPTERAARSISIKYIDSDNPREDIKKDEATKIRAQSKKKDRIWTEVPRKLASREAIESLGYEFEETRQHFYVFEYLEQADINELTGLSSEIQQGRRRKLLNRFETPEEDPSRSRSAEDHITSPSASSDPIPDMEDNPPAEIRKPGMRHPPSQVTDDSDIGGSTDEGDFNNDLQQPLDIFHWISNQTEMTSRQERKRLPTSLPPPLS